MKSALINTSYNSCYYMNDENNIFFKRENSLQKRDEVEFDNVLDELFLTQILYP